MTLEESVAQALDEWHRRWHLDFDEDGESDLETQYRHMAAWILQWPSVVRALHLQSEDGGSCREL